MENLRKFANTIKRTFSPRRGRGRHFDDADENTTTESVTTEEGTEFIENSEAWPIENHEFALTNTFQNTLSVDLPPTPLEQIENTNIESESAVEGTEFIENSTHKTSVQTLTNTFQNILTPKGKNGHFVNSTENAMDREFDLIGNPPPMLPADQAQARAEFGMTLDQNSPSESPQSYNSASTSSSSIGFSNSFCFDDGSHSEPSTNNSPKKKRKKSRLNTVPQAEEAIAKSQDELDALQLEYDKFKRSNDPEQRKKAKELAKEKKKVQNRMYHQQDKLEELKQAKTLKKKKSSDERESSNVPVPAPAPAPAPTPREENYLKSIEVLGKPVINWIKEAQKFHIGLKQHVQEVTVINKEHREHRSPFNITHQYTSATLFGFPSIVGFSSGVIAMGKLKQGDPQEHREHRKDLWDKCWLLYPGGELHRIMSFLASKGHEPYNHTCQLNPDGDRLGGNHFKVEVSFHDNKPKLLANNYRGYLEEIDDMEVTVFSSVGETIETPMIDPFFHLISMKEEQNDDAGTRTIRVTFFFETNTGALHWKTFHIFINPQASHSCYPTPVWNKENEELSIKPMLELAQYESLAYNFQETKGWALQERAKQLHAMLKVVEKLFPTKQNQNT